MHRRPLLNATVGVLLAVGMAVLPFQTAAALAQSDSELGAIDRYLRGRQFLVAYREGGAAYGTHIRLEVHYCPSGQFVLFGQSRRQTVLDNWQVNNWEDAGRWDVIRVQGQPGVRAVSIAGRTDFAPVKMLPDGRLWAGDGVSVQLRGAARCK